MRAVDSGPDQPQASSQCRARPERQVLSQPTAFPVRELSPGRFGASPAPSPRCAQERSPPPSFALAEGATPALCPGGRRYESCTSHHLFQGSPDGHASAVPCRTTRDRQLADSNPGLPTSLLEFGTVNIGIPKFTPLGSPGRVRNLHRKTPLERRERQYRQQGTNLQGVDGGS